LKQVQFQSGENTIKSNNHNGVGDWIFKGDKYKTDNGHKKELNPFPGQRNKRKYSIVSLAIKQ